jgi:hypothetical protein
MQLEWASASRIGRNRILVGSYTRIRQFGRIRTQDPDKQQEEEKKRLRRKMFKLIKSNEIKF